MRIYLDASAIIYALESAAPFRDLVISRIAQAESTPDRGVVTSRLSRLECRVKPLREGNADGLAKFELFFTRKSVAVAEITPAVIERATELRARYGLRTPDAIHVATAIEERADLLLTGDAGLARCADIKVEVLQP